MGQWILAWVGLKTLQTRRSICTRGHTTLLTEDHIQIFFASTPMTHTDDLAVTHLLMFRWPYVDHAWAQAGKGKSALLLDLELPGLF